MTNQQPFDKQDYDNLHSLVFRPDYKGYKPAVKEIPAGDGKVDEDKRFAHVAPKYFADDWQRAALMPYLLRAHELAIMAALRADIPAQYWPDIRYGALRVLDYPAGAVSNRHEDFDLFTLMMYRPLPQYFKSDDVEAGPAIQSVREVNPQAHLGLLGQEIGLGTATPHWVEAAPEPQHSIVYFTIPDHEAPLGAGNVRDWLNDIMSRTRTEFKAYAKGDRYE